MSDDDDPDREPPWPQWPELVFDTDPETGHLALFVGGDKSDLLVYPGDTLFEHGVRVGLTIAELRALRAEEAARLAIERLNERLLENVRAGLTDLEREILDRDPATAELASPEIIREAEQRALERLRARADPRELPIPDIHVAVSPEAVDEVLAANAHLIPDDTE